MAVETYPVPVHDPERLTVAARIVDGVKLYGSGATAVRALDGISAAFAPGEFCAIMGPSGSGKSTLLHCMAGLDRLTSGRRGLDEPLSVPEWWASAAHRR